MADFDIDEAERIAMMEESRVAQLLAHAITKIRQLRHELNDPNYLYSGRIHRQSILCRNAQIDRLLEENKKMKATIAELSGVKISS